MCQYIGQSQDGRIYWCIEVLVSQRMEELIVVSRYWSVTGWKNLLVYRGIGQSEDGRIDWFIKVLVSQRMEELVYQGIGQSDSEDGRIDWCIKVLVSQRMEELIGVSRYWSVRLRGWKN